MNRRNAPRGHPTAQLGYEKYEAKGTLGVPDSGNSRNGKRPKQLRTSAGDTRIAIPRDRNGEFSSKLLEKHQTSTNELEEKILAMYGKGMSESLISHARSSPQVALPG